MNRNYNIKNVIDIVKEIKSKNGDIKVTTQFIYWFPTETFEEFKDYFRILNVFDELWFWYYSDRKWTKSINFEWKISKNQMIKRLLFLWKFKEKYINKIFDKNELLQQWINIFNARSF
jgi:tRNA A37 methylthiotransferase MiaB